MMNETNSIPPAEVNHNRAAQRFELHVGGEVCVLEYRISNGRMVIYHTEVPRRLEGQGLAARLTHAALEFARAENLRVEPRCPYTAAFFQEHAEYRDLLG